MFSKSILTTVALSLALCQEGFAATAAQWRSRSIYQVLTDRFARADGSTTAACNAGNGRYCGGSFKGIQSQLAYIQGMGFDAIWISPVTAQISTVTAYGDPYHGYWQQNLYGINGNFGTAADLKALSAALHARGMYLMVDIVVNHNGWNGAPSSIDYTKFNPFNKASQYHPYCAINYNDAETNTTNIEQCWVGDTTVSLPDLRTENSDVAAGYQTFIKQLVANYTIDGLRMDTALEVNTGFWSGFSSAAGVYMVGEIDSGDGSFVCGFQKFIAGVMNYGTYFSLVSAFSSTSGSMSNLASMVNTVKSACTDTSLLGTFSENHDNPRFASITSDLAAARNALAFSMLVDGIPIVYEGQEQHYNGANDPYNREAVWLSGYSTTATLYTHITTMNKIRKNAIKDDSTFLSYQAYPMYTDTTTIIMRKGKLVSVLSNKGTSGASYSQTYAVGYTAGQKVTELLTCTAYTATSSGGLLVPMAAGAPRIFYPTASLAGSGLCGNAASKMRFMARS